jgi:UDP-glucuronate decarboxylase
VKKVLITGASGQVGTRLLKLLPKSEYDIFAVTSNPSKTKSQLPIKSIFLDLLEDEIDPIVQKIAPTLLIHLAWETSPTAFWDSPKNEKWLEASKDLVTSFCRHGGEKIVVSGTCAEYDWRGTKPLAETDAEFPQSIYGQAKLDLLNFLRGQSVPYLWTRTFFQFGDKEPYGRIFSSAIDTISSGNEFLIRKPEDIRDYIYVDDVAKIIASLVLSGEEGVFNIGSGKGITMRELGEKIASSLGRPELIKFQNQEGNQSVVVANTAKMEKALGGFRGTSLLNAINKTIGVRGEG